MKKTYIQPTTDFVCTTPTTLMAASGGADSQVDSGNGPSGDMDKDENGSDETGAKYNAWSEWED